MLPLISLIIPVYNVEKYLARCLDSVIKQSYPNYEVILVDDGSTDNSGAICDQYAEANERLRVFHNENSGLSFARNFGVQKASGDLVTFIDSDDVVTCDYVEYLYYLMDKYKSDLSFCPVTTIVGDDVEQKQTDKTPEERCVSTAEGVKLLCTYVSACAKLYQKECLLKNPYPVGKLHEDIATTYRIAALCRTVSFSTKHIYYHMQNRDSICNSKITQKRLYVLEAADKQVSFVEKNFPVAVEAAVARRWRSVIELMTQTSLLQDEKDGREYFDILRNYVKERSKGLFRNPEASLQIKITIIMILLGYYPAKFFWPIREKIKCLVQHHDCIKDTK